MSDTVRAPKCPYLSSMGFYEIHCQLHCLRIVDKGFENPKLLQQHTEEYCFLDFDKCETYKQIHKKEMESTDSLILGYRECAFCCNNSGYTGLNGQNGSTHGFCQVRQEAVPKFDTGSVCEWFNRLKREEVREVAKQTYYTKCGRQFEKNSTAVVTGYDIDINDPECADCPFQVDVKEGWPQVHKKWECRAGSQPPNHTTEWTGSLENKNTMSIHSLDNQLMEEIKEYCENHPDLGASYNADHMADCRRTMAISCSSNKKGIAAKRELIEKFFPEATAVPDQRFEKDICGDCSHLIDDGSCVSGYGRCNYKNRRMAKDHEACVAFEQALFDVQKCRVCGCTEDNACEGGCYWVEDDLCSKCADAIAEDEEQIYIYRGLV